MSQCICKGKDAQVLIKNNHCCLNTMSFIYLISFSFCSHVLAEACSKVVFFIRITKDHIYQIAILGRFFGANQDTEPGLYSIKWRSLTGIGIPIINLRWSDDHFRFMMGILIPQTRCLHSCIVNRCTEFQWCLAIVCKVLKPMEVLARPVLFSSQFVIIF